MTTVYETPAEADTAELRAGDDITVDELAVHLSAIDLRLRRLARAAETPATPVELADTIDALRTTARQVRELGERMALLARITEGHVPLAAAFDRGDPWGAAALQSDRADYGGPAVIPTQWQLLKLATDAERHAEAGRAKEVTTYPEAMAGLPALLTGSWESKTARARRAREFEQAVTAEVLALPCARCEAEPGHPCRTTTGWQAEQPHAGRLREAKERVSARIGNPADMQPAASGPR